jgi:mono/diheme cytochrome c family protein
MDEQQAVGAAPATTPSQPGESASGVSNQDSSEVAEGRELFNGTCAHCHGPGAVTNERRINLRLMQRRYRDKMDEVFMHTVTNGRPEKGMPNWTGAFSNDDFTKILTFLHSVQMK